MNPGPHGPEPALSVSSRVPPVPPVSSCTQLRSPSFPLVSAVSTGRRNTGLRRRLRQSRVECFGGCVPAQGLTRPIVDFGGDELQVAGAPEAEIGAFRKVQAKEAVGVLVGAALPGFGRVAEVDLQTSGNADLSMSTHLRALVPGQRLPERPGHLLGRRQSRCRAPSARPRARAAELQQRRGHSI